MILAFHGGFSLVLLVEVGVLWVVGCRLCAHKLQVKQWIASAARIVVVLDVVYDLVFGQLTSCLWLALILKLLLPKLLIHVHRWKCGSCATTKLPIRSYDWTNLRDKSLVIFHFLITHVVFSLHVRDPNLADIISWRIMLLLNSLMLTFSIFKHLNV